VFKLQATTAYLHINCKAFTPCDLNFIVKGERTSPGHRQSRTLGKW